MRWPAGEEAPDADASDAMPEIDAADVDLTRSLLNKERPRAPAFKGRSGVTGTSLNLMNTMIGAGLMALPHVFAMTGLVLGVVLTIIVTFFMYYCSSVLIRRAHYSGHRTYTEVAREELGWFSGAIIQWSIILNNGGVLVVYLIIIGDLLVGTAETGYHGLLPSMLNIEVGEGSALPWYLTRRFVVFVVCIVFLQPLLIQKRLHVLARTSAFAIGLATAFAALTTVLAVLGAIQKRLPPVHWGLNDQVKEPDITRNCNAAIVMTAIPVLLYSFVFLFNIPPLMAELKGYSKPRMLKAVRRSLMGTTTLYVIVAVTATLVFGVTTHQDVLVNLNATALEKFMGPDMADTVSTVLALGYAGKLILIFPLANWSLRENLADLAFKTQRPEGWRFYAVTYAILALVFLLSQTVRGVLNAMNIIGCTACVGLTFVVPAFLIEKFECRDARMKLLALGVWLLGMFCLLQGVLGEVWRGVFRVPLFC